MREKVEIEINNLINILDSDERINKLLLLKERISNTPSVLEKVEKSRKLDRYSDEYRKIKKELFENSDFVDFKELENEINYLILEINKRFKELTDERRCGHASN